MLLLVNTVIKNESTLHLLSLNRTLTANVMVVNVLRKWVPHAHSSVVDCVFINAHQEAQVFMTCSSDGAICLWDLRGDLVDTFRSNTSSSDILWPLQRSAELRVLKLSTLTGVASRVETDPRVLSTSTSPSSSLVSLASARRIPMAVKTDHKARTTRPRMNMHFKYSKAMLQRIEMHHKTQQKHEQLHLYHELNALDAKMAKSRKS
jgi:WD40 repeat protein